MKKVCCLLLTLCLVLCVTVTTAQADLLDDLLDGFIGSGASGGTEQKELSPNDYFTGKTVKVKISGKTYQVHAAFKDLMDDYLDFYKEYAKCMNQMNMANYTKMMSRYVEICAEMEVLDKWEDNMSEGDEAYYLKTLLEIDKVLLSDM